MRVVPRAGWLQQLREGALADSLPCGLRRAARPRARGLLLAFALLLLSAIAAASPTDPKRPGDTASALPGVARVGVAATGPVRVSAAATAGYGHTEALASQEGPNHRLVGILAVAGAPLPWLELGLRLDGRYNIHPKDEHGSDDNLIGDPRLSARAGQKLADAVHLGAELVLWTPGGDAPSVAFDASTIDARALIAYRPPDSGLTLAALGGWRFDNSGAAGADPRTMRLGDRISLGLSDFDAVLAGVGASQWLGSVELLGEFSADILMGSGAPPLSQSPLRATAGARYQLSPPFQLEALADVSLSGRPAVGPNDALVPIEPRFTLLVGMRYCLELGEKPKPPPPKPAPPPKVKKPAAKPKPPPPPPEPTTGTLAGSIIDESGQPIESAYVTIIAGDVRDELEAGADGKFTIEEMAIGEVRVIVEAEGFEKVEKKTQISAAKPATLEFMLRPAVPAGQLRGLVRSFAGRPLKATIRVEGTDIETTTDAEGMFEVDVPPGSYTISIKAEGHVGQRRNVRIEDRGVTIINADLKEKPWR